MRPAAVGGSFYYRHYQSNYRGKQSAFGFQNKSLAPAIQTKKSCRELALVSTAEALVSSYILNRPKSAILDPPSMSFSKKCSANHYSRHVESVLDIKSIISLNLTFMIFVYQPSDHLPEGAEISNLTGNQYPRILPR